MTISIFIYLIITTMTLVSSSKPLAITRPISYTQGFNETIHTQFFKFTDFSSIDGGALQLTPDNENQDNGYFNKSGRVTFYKPFTLWTDDDNPNTVVSFNTTFVINIYRNKVWNPGEGLAFVISPGFDVSPESHGQWLGLTNATTDGRPENSLVAIEFDTEKQDFDPDDNHVGLNINSVKSVKTESMNKHGFLLSPEKGTDYRVWIEYNGRAKVIEVYIANRTGEKPADPVMTERLNLREHVRKSSYFGFSASTGNPGIQYNCVLEWELTIERVSPKNYLTAKIGIGVGVSVAALALMVFVGVKFGLYSYVKKRKRARDEESNVVGALKRLPGMLREFRYKDLKRATESFDESRVLGRGGFGIVYRGVLRERDQHDHNNINSNNNNSVTSNSSNNINVLSLSNSNISGSGRTNNSSNRSNYNITEVAVKKFSRDDIKSKDDFLAELTIIHRLRHKHLVRLVGWCYEKGKLLLVYDYMPNGSLDKHLYGGSTTLNWRHRHKILAGVASGLHYLHNDYDQKVVHRDLKASNILLDADYNARLGDFGLARAIENERNSYAELGHAGVPGTMGYVAPECFHMGKATPESDVFGFGAVVLEVVCGRSPGEKIHHEEHQLTLVEWVWMLHREGRIGEAVDDRLRSGGEYVVDEANRLLLLGLACSHPVATERPQTQAICQIIAETLPPPRVPPFQPVFTWPAFGVKFGFNSTESGLSSTTLSSGNVKKMKSNTPAL